MDSKGETGGFNMLLNRIKEKLPQLTNSQRKIATYILQNAQDVAFMTAGQIGQKVGLSESTVVRLATTLGFRGFPEMKIAIKNVVVERLSTLERLEDYGEETDEGISKLCFHALKDDHDTLARTMTEIMTQNIEELAKKIVQADQIFVVGHLSSKALAYFLWYYLSWFFPNAHLFEMTLANEKFVNATDKSLVIGISFPRYTRWTVETLRFAKESGIQTASITSDYSGPLAMYSDTIITVPWKPLSFIDSFTAPMSILNCIILATAKVMGPEAHDKLKKLEKMWENNDVYA